MISYYQTRLLPFLSLKAWAAPKKIYTHYYLSWEDALWDILPGLGLKKGSTILLPDFYCLDVIGNVISHGYQVVTYPLDTNFQISKSKFLQIYRQTKPGLVIFFHACGITNLLSRDQSLIQLLSKNSYILEDSVHRIIDSSDLTFLSDKHFVLDSLRKNTPLSGSFLYAPKPIFDKLPMPKIKNVSYTLQVILLYWHYLLTLRLGVGLKHYPLVKYANNHVLKTHDDLVGDSLLGNAGMPWVPYLYHHLDFHKIKNHKIKQVQYYLKHLPTVFIPKIKDSNLGELHAFPLVIQKRLAEKVKNKLDTLNVWPKFTDCRWSKDRLVFFLPLGFHITQADQDLTIRTITQATK